MERLKPPPGRNVTQSREKKFPPGASGRVFDLTVQVLPENSIFRFEDRADCVIPPEAEKITAKRIISAVFIR
jgi:hypothetical protein